MKKLVRDKIPEIVQDKKIKFRSTVSDNEYWEKLKEKLQEEVGEFIKDQNEDELADILEVVYAIGEFKNINPQELEKLREKKKEEKGGFKKRIILEK